MHNMIKLLYLVFSIGASMQCALVKSDHFIRNDQMPPGKPLLLRGSGWPGWKYGYDLQNAVHFENHHLLGAIRINTYTSRWWATGVILPIVPTFGLVSFRESNADEGHISARIFFKTKASVVVAACNFKFQNTDKTHRPVRVSYALGTQNRETINCQPTQDSSITLSVDKHSDLLDIDIVFDESLKISEGTLFLPPLTVNKAISESPPLKLIRDWELLYFPAIL